MLRFSALQRAEIAEIATPHHLLDTLQTVSVLFNEPKLLKSMNDPRTERVLTGFSALQRAEIAEMSTRQPRATTPPRVSVLFNEPKLLK